MEKIIVGKIVNVAGLKGEVKVYNYSDSDEIYRITPGIFIGDELFEIEKVRTKKNMVILKLEGIDDRNRAEGFREKNVYITEEDLPELPKGEFYIRDIIGMVVEDEKGCIIGDVRDVIQNTAQDILEVELESGKKILIPKVDEYVANIDGEAEKITVKHIEGLMEL